MKKDKSLRNHKLKRKYLRDVEFLQIVLRHKFVANQLNKKLSS